MNKVVDELSYKVTRTAKIWSKMEMSVWVLVGREVKTDHARAACVNVELVLDELEDFLRYA